MPADEIFDKTADGVFIMYHRKSDNSSLIVKPHKWTSLQNSGEIADGVAIVEGGKILVVAPTQATTKLTWSSGEVSGGGTTTWDRVTALNDWNGKTNTQKQIAASKEGAVTNTTSYAPGFCNLYSRSNANGKGLTAGKWWLPSLGETRPARRTHGPWASATATPTAATALRRPFRDTFAQFQHL